MLCHLMVLSLTSFCLCRLECYLPSLLFVGADQSGGARGIITTVHSFLMVSADTMMHVLWVAASCQALPVCIIILQMKTRASFRYLSH